MGKKLTTEVIEQELKRVKGKEHQRASFKRMLYALIVVAAIAVLVATLYLPILQIYGNSMTPTLHDGQLIVSVKDANMEQGDIIAFYYNNKILVKRVIATAGEWVSIDDNGVITVNGKILEEPYISEQSLGECNIDFPYQVPEGKLFVMGDHRSVSIDSRHWDEPYVAIEEIVAKHMFSIPLHVFSGR